MYSSSIPCIPRDSCCTWYHSLDSYDRRYSCSTPVARSCSTSNRETKCKCLIQAKVVEVKASSSAFVLASLLACEWEDRDCCKHKSFGYYSTRIVCYNPCISSRSCSGHILGIASLCCSWQSRFGLHPTNLVPHSRVTLRHLLSSCSVSRDRNERPDRGVILAHHLLV